MTRHSNAKHRSRNHEIQTMLLEMRPGCLLAFWFFLGLPFVCLGIFFLYQGVNEALGQTWLSSRSIEAPATIISSDMMRPVGVRSDSASFFPKIKYTYEYEGIVRESDRVWMVSEADTQSAIQKLVDKFPEGAKTIAYVDAQFPEVSVLEKRWSLMVYVSIYLGILPILFVTSLGLLLSGWRWPGVSLVLAPLITILTTTIVGAALWHCRTSLPDETHKTWFWIVSAVAGCLSFAPLFCLLKVRQLNRLYQKALHA